jgi:hypothetical protein
MLEALISFFIVDISSQILRFLNLLFVKMAAISDPLPISVPSGPIIDHLDLL